MPSSVPNATININRVNATITPKMFPSNLPEQASCVVVHGPLEHPPESEGALGGIVPLDLIETKRTTPMGLHCS